MPEIWRVKKEYYELPYGNSKKEYYELPWGNYELASLYLPEAQLDIRWITSVGATVVRIAADELLTPGRHPSSPDKLKTPTKQVLEVDAVRYDDLLARAKLLHEKQEAARSEARDSAEFWAETKQLFCSGQ